MKSASSSGRLSEMEMPSLSWDRGRSHGHHVSVVEQLPEGETVRKYVTSHRGGGLFGSAQQPLPAKRLGRTPSSPSVFFSKVKERIREKVYETSAEWPHMAAIVQERRQRAADAFEARMSIRRLQNAALLQGHGGTVAAADSSSEVHGGEESSGHRCRRVRIKSDQAVHHHRASPSSSSSCASSSTSNSFDKEGAKSAFRRRSISEDTYNRQPGGSSQQPEEDRGGVVCSNDELRAIVFGHKLRRSPVALKHPENGSGSLECCQESMLSCDSLSNNSVVSSNPKLHACRRDSSHFPPSITKESPPVLPLSGSASQQRDLVAEMNSGSICPVSLTITNADDVDAAGPRTETADRLGGDVRRNSVVIREVVFDEHGQTWDIYGAEFDPEILGQAIQNHLEKIMRKRLLDRSKILGAEPVLCLRSDSPECRPMCANGERRTQRALGFFLSYLCTVARQKEHITG